MFVALTAVMAQISIPLPGSVPFTLQTLAIPLAGVFLGAKRGALCAGVYLLLGAVGAPVFAGFAGGPGIVLGPTGGFLLTFPLMAALAGLGAKRGGPFWLYAGLTAGAAVNLLGGLIMYCFVLQQSPAAAFAACVLPFLPTTVLKIVLAGLLGLRAQRTELLRRIAG